ncbi:MAG: hypothetical protein C4519_06015 [Desulfobacteraceae bacterium]|nr:MAG: hypothetical protein C4519_06015 [Desulfobacteraceae bacterium]
MTTTAFHDDLAGWIRQVLQAPMRLDGALLDFVEETFGTADPSALSDDMDGSEAASFWELLFFPDQRLRLEFETHYGERAFSGAQAAALANELLREPITATLQTDVAPYACTVQVPAFVITALIERLKITWQAPQRLIDILRGTLTDRHRIEVRARLRQTRVRWHDGQISMIGHFLARMPAESNDFNPCLEFLLSHLGELRPVDAPFEFLVARKFFLFQSLCQHEAFEQRRRSRNMETLILQGARVAHGDSAQWRAGMRLVDRICTALYGRTHFFQRTADSCLEAECGEPRDLETLFRQLS